MKLIRYLLAAGVVSLLAACGSDDHTTQVPQPKTILATAQETPALSSLSRPFSSRVTATIW